MTMFFYFNGGGGGELLGKEIHYGCFQNQTFFKDIFSLNYIITVTMLHVSLGDRMRPNAKDKVTKRQNH